MIPGIFKLIALVLIAFGIFHAFDIDIKEFFDDLSKPFQNKRKNIREQVLLLNGKKKENNFSLLMKDTRNILQITGQEDIFPKLCVLSAAAAIGGMILGFALTNYFIIPVFSTGFCTIPFVYIKITGAKMKKQIGEELETSLSVITSSYIRSELFAQAVEENISYINSPVKEVFQSFLIETNHISSDMVRNIKIMREKLDNEVFREWCDAVTACQKNADLKYTLPPIVKKLSNIRLVTVRLDAMMYAPVKEFISLLFLLVFNIPLFYFINRLWFDILVNYTIGKLVLAICAAVTLFSIAGVIRVTRPIEYRR